LALTFLSDIPPDVKFLLLAVGVLLAANFIAVLLHFLYRALSDSPLREVIRSIIYYLDEFADDMSNVKKRADAIRQVNEVLGWRRVVVPAVIIGWVIDAEVAAIRKMQKTANTPNLHEEEKI
jgi:hypothetical protein